MKATVAHFVGANRPLELVEVEVPQLRVGEVLARIDLAAVCGSDLHTWAGVRPEVTPCTLGHEGIGTVVDSNRAGVKPGMRVTWSLVDSCGSCVACAGDDLPQKCERLTKYGHGSSGLDGTYASHMVLRSGTAIFELPTELDDRLAVSLNCAMATSVEALRDLPEPNQALVLGAGMVSLFAAWVLRERGWEVTVVDGAAGRREIASKIGLRSVESCEGSHRLVFEGAGSRDLLWSSYEHLRPGGEIRIVGLSHPESELGLTGQDILRRCWRVRGSHNYAPAALRAAMDLAVGFGRVAPLEMMFGPAWGLGAVNSALAEARLRRWMRSLVAP